MRPTIPSTMRLPVAFALLALGVYWLQALGWPLRGGRDVHTYLLYYAGIGQDPPLFPVTMTAIQPLSPAILGLLLDRVGGASVEILLSLMFAISVGAWVRLGAAFGRQVAFAIGVALLVYPPYAGLFHELASDQLFAFGLALWSLLVAWALRDPAAWRFVVAGSALLFLALARAAGVPLAIAALSPLLLALPWRRRLLYSGAFLASCLAALILSTTYNGLRYGEFTLSRTANAGTLFGVFAHDRLVRPENGPASRRLAAAVADDLLDREPYRAYGIRLDSFFADASDRYWSDLVPLSDRVWGWDSRYATLRAAAVEAARSHPGPYLRSVLRKLGHQFSVRTDRTVTRRPAPPAADPGSLATGSYVTVGGRRLPAPTEGQPIPAAHLDWQLSTPDEGIWMDWSSIERPEVRFATERMAAQHEEMQRKVAELSGKLASRDGSERVADALNWISRYFPALWLWVFAGVLGIAVRRPRGSAVIVALVAVAFAAITAAALTQPLMLPYRIPFDPIFLLFGLVGLFGAQQPQAGSTAAATPSRP